MTIANQPPACSITPPNRRSTTQDSARLAAAPRAALAPRGAAGPLPRRRLGLGAAEGVRCPGGTASEQQWTARFSWPLEDFLGPALGGLLIFDWLIGLDVLSPLELQDALGWVYHCGTILNGIFRSDWRIDSFACGWQGNLASSRCTFVCLKMAKEVDKSLARWNLNQLELQFSWLHHA